MATAPKLKEDDLKLRFAELGRIKKESAPTSRSSSPESTDSVGVTVVKSEHDKGMDIMKAAFGEQPLRPTTGRGKKKTRKSKKSHRKTKKHLRRK